MVVLVAVIGVVLVVVPVPVVVVVPVPVMVVVVVKIMLFVAVHYLMAVRLSTARQAVHPPSGGWWYRWDNNRTKCLHRGEFRMCLLMASLKIAG